MVRDAILYRRKNHRLLLTFFGRKKCGNVQKVEFFIKKIVKMIIWVFKVIVLRTSA